MEVSGVHAVSQLLHRGPGFAERPCGVVVAGDHTRSLIAQATQNVTIDLAHIEGVGAEPEGHVQPTGHVVRQNGWAMGEVAVQCIDPAVGERGEFSGLAGRVALPEDMHRGPQPGHAGLHQGIVARLGGDDEPQEPG